jgi:hypothetical protein
VASSKPALSEVEWAQLGDGFFPKRVIPSPRPAALTLPLTVLPIPYGFKKIPAPHVILNAAERSEGSGLRPEATSCSLARFFGFASA